MREWKALHQVVWTSSRPPGSEYCAVRRVAAGWTLKGTVARRFQEGIAGITYTIQTDRDWRTMWVRVEQLLNGTLGRVEIEVRRGRWSVGGKESPDLRGCVDVDLEVSPVTNTLPLKRTGIGVGSKVDLKVAWVRFPSLKVLTLQQSYERLGKNRYRYRSASGFEAELDVDDFGLVRRYGEFWTAV